MTDIIVDTGNTFERCLGLLKDKTKNTDINATTIIKVIKIAMEIVEATQLKGSAQKELVNKLTRQIIVDAPITDHKEKLLLEMIDEGIVSNMIDLVISATRGELNLNAAQDVAKNCCMNLCEHYICGNNK